MDSSGLNETNAAPPAEPPPVASEPVAASDPPESPAAAAAPTAETLTTIERELEAIDQAAPPNADAADAAPVEAAPVEALGAAAERAAGEPAAAEPAAAQTAATPPPAPKKPDPANEEKRRRAQAAWEKVVAAKDAGETVSSFVTAVVKGGLLVDVGGIRGFLPASQVRAAEGSTVEALVKTRLPVKVIDVDNNRRRIVVSARRAADEDRRSKRSELLASLEVGQVREVTVVRLADFGAFADLGGIDGLIPMSELAFERVEKAGDVVKVGEKLNVEVLRIQENGKKIALSRKNALPDPWRDHPEVVRQGAKIEGKVVAKEPRLQVEIAPGIVGSVRESEANPADYEIGEAVEVTVRFVDRRTRRITLSTLAGDIAAAPPSQSSWTGSGFAPLGVELGRRS